MILPADPDLEKLNTDQPDALIGTLIADRYRIIEIAGAGGMGVVYKAEQIHMSRMVALKMLLRGADEHAFKRFRQEARAASLLDHPNIVGIYDFDVIHDAQAYLAMDFLDGASLAELVRSEGPLSSQRVLHMFLQACDALEHAHNHGVVHRDIKPSNLVLVEKNGDRDFLKIVDFGLVKLMGGGEDQKLTSTNMVMGSPLYMSPEQCRGLGLDHRTDIYSLGCVMYEALVGQPPLSGATPLDTLYKHIATAPPAMSVANPNVFVPLALEEVVQKAMSKDPANRQQSMAELREQLIASAGGRGQVALTQSSASAEAANLLSRPALPSSLVASGVGARAVSGIRRKRRPALVHWAMPAAFISIVSAAVIGSLVFVIFQQQKQEREVLQQEALLESRRVPPAAVREAPVAGPAPVVDKVAQPPGPAPKAGDDKAANLKAMAAERARRLEQAQLAEAAAQIAYESGDWATAAQQYEKCLPLQEQLFGQHHQSEVPVVAKLIVCLVNLNDLGGAARYTNRFAALYKQHPQPLQHDPSLLQTVSQASHTAGNMELAEILLSDAITAHDSSPNPKLEESLRMRLALANLFEEAHQLVPEEKVLRQVYDNSRRNPMLRMKAEYALVRCLREQGREQDAQAMTQQFQIGAGRRRSGMSGKFGVHQYRQQQ